MGSAKISVPATTQRVTTPVADETCCCCELSGFKSRQNGIPDFTKQHTNNFRLAQRRAEKRTRKERERSRRRAPVITSPQGTTKKLTSTSTPVPLMAIPPGKFEASNSPPAAKGALGEVLGAAWTGRGSWTCATGKPCWWGEFEREERERRERVEGECGGKKLALKKKPMRRILSLSAPVFIAQLRTTPQLISTLSHHGKMRSTQARTSSKSSGWRTECVPSTTFLVAAATSDAEKPSLAMSEAYL